MGNIFQNVIVKKPKRSTFNLSHDVKFTMDFGKLVPFMCEEVIPGDTWKNKSNILVRFSPLVSPVMHDINVYTHFFFVPNRLVWDNWEEFIVSGPNSEYPSNFPRVVLPSRTQLGALPAQDQPNYKAGSLLDYLNYPISDSIEVENFSVSALPLRAYQLIYNEYYRDENLQSAIQFSRGDGTNPSDYVNILKLRNRAWSKDYFTSALPWPMKGDIQKVPVIGTAEINGEPGSIKFNPPMVMEDSTQVVGPHLGYAYSSGSDSGEGRIYTTAGTGIISFDNSHQLYIDGQQVDITGLGFTINDLRRASRIQQWQENSGRFGSRFVETLLGHFGVISDDARLQRPEYLGGGKTPVSISDVLQTSETTDTTPQGNMAGLAYSLGESNTFQRTFKEHGYIIGIMSVMPKGSYIDGCPKGYRKFTFDQFYWPEFAHLGEQEIKNSELALLSDPDGTFGYAPRYAEYKYIPSRVHGGFRNISGDLGQWTLARKFINQPRLNSQFITMNAADQQLNRIFAIEGSESTGVETNNKHLYVQVRNNTIARRPMPYLPDPSL